MVTIRWIDVDWNEVMIGSVLVYVPGSASSPLDAQSIREIITHLQDDNTVELENALSIVTDLSPNGNTESLVRRLAQIESVLVERSGFHNDKDNVLIDIAAARLAKQVNKLCAIPNEAPCIFCEQADKTYKSGRQETWVYEEFDRLSGVGRFTQQVDGPLTDIAVEILAHALALSWQPVNEAGLSPKDSHLRSDRRLEAARKNARILLQKDKPLAFASATDAVGYICAYANDKGTEVLERASAAFADFVAKTVSNVSERDILRRHIFHVGIRAISSPINARLLEPAANDRVESRGLIILIDANSADARLLLQGVVSAEIPIEGGDLHLPKPGTTDGGFEECEGGSDIRDHSSLQMYRADDAETIIKALDRSTGEALLKNGIAPIIVAESFHEEVRRELGSDYDVISIDNEVKALSLKSFKRFVTCVAEHEKIKSIA